MCGVKAKNFIDYYSCYGKNIYSVTSKLTTLPGSVYYLVDSEVVDWFKIKVFVVKDKKK